MNYLIITKAKILSILAFIAFCFVACGDDSTIETQPMVNETQSEVVANLAGLPECSTSNDGEQVFVKDEKIIKVCSNGEWYGLLNPSASVDTVRVPNECFSESLKDSSGVKIICDGDSVGVVLNGKNGEKGSDGKNGEQGPQGNQGVKGLDGASGDDCTVVSLANDEGLKVLCDGDSVGVLLNGKNGENGLDSVSNCAIVTKECVLHVACGKDTVSLEMESSEKSCKEKIVLDSEAIAVNLDGIGGNSQKGPFLKGSEVVAYELLNGRSLQQTGKTFQGKILSDSGNFDIKTVSLASQYATLMVKGYYLNEVTGSPSKSQITLTALTNLRGRSTANINLLTHLENERAQYLVVMGRKTVAAAKKMAEAEVFNLFHIDSKDFAGYSEDLNINGTSDADAALLAISILLQGDRTEAELSALLTVISTAMEKTGKWNDTATKISIADWAASADSAGRFPKFRENVEKWGLTEHAANFEPLIRNYWYQELGLEPCTADNIGVVAAVSAGTRKESKTRFTCVDSSDAVVGKVWRISTDFEKDTYGWKPGVDGQREPGLCNTDKFYFYDESLKNWRTPADECESNLGICTEKREGEFGEIDDSWWVCRSRKWTESSSLEIDIVGWNAGEDGEVRKGNGGTCYYVYDQTESAWRTASELDVSLETLGCTANRAGKMFFVSDENSPHHGKFFVCQANHDWKETSDLVEINTNGVVCNKDGKMVNGRFDTETWYVCENKKWREATTSEEAKKNACLASMVDSIVSFNGKDFVCAESNNWRTTSFYDYAYDEFDFSKHFKKTSDYIDTLFVDPRDGKKYNLVRIQKSNPSKGIDYDRVWFAENLHFADSSSYPNLKGQSWCYKERHGDCTVGGRYYTWTAAMNVLQKYKEGNPSEVPGLVGSPHQGICPDGWHIPSVGEWEDYINAEGYDRVPGFTIHSTGYYNGSKKSFIDFDQKIEKRYVFVATTSPYGYGFSIWPDGNLGGTTADGRSYGYSVRCVQDINEDFSLFTCYKDGSLINGIKDKKISYVCDADTFRVAETLEEKLELGCTSFNENATLIKDKIGYICQNSQWSVDPKADYRSLPCPEDGSLLSGLLNSDNKYVCEADTIRAATSGEKTVGKLCVEGLVVYDVDVGTSSPVPFHCKNKAWSPIYFYEYSLDQWEIYLEKNTPTGVTYGSLLDSRDGNVYKTLVLDGKTWMAENLRYADSTATPNLKGNSKCFNNLEKNCTIAGRLYTWGAAMNLPSGYDSEYAHEDGVDSTSHQGICPDGWRLPTAGEWKSLVTEERTVNDLVYTGIISWSSATNKSGFSLLPAGSYSSSDFYGPGYITFFWTTTEYESHVQPAYVAQFYSGGYSIILRSKTDGLSVRCLKN